MSTPATEAKAVETVGQQPHAEETKAAQAGADQPPKLSPTQGENDGEKKSAGKGSEAGVAADYLPINKLKDVPSASHYDGTPVQYAHVLMLRPDATAG